MSDLEATSTRYSIVAPDQTESSEVSTWNQQEGASSGKCRQVADAEVQRAQVTSCFIDNEQLESTEAGLPPGRELPKQQPSDAEQQLSSTGNTQSNDQLSIPTASTRRSSQSRGVCSAVPARHPTLFRFRIVQNLPAGLPFWAGRVDPATGQLLDCYPSRQLLCGVLHVPFTKLLRLQLTKEVVNGYQVVYLAPIDTCGGPGWCQWLGNPGYEVSEDGRVRYVEACLEHRVRKPSTKQPEAAVCARSEQVGVGQLVGDAFGVGCQEQVGSEARGVGSNTCEAMREARGVEGKTSGVGSELQPPAKSSGREGSDVFDLGMGLSPSLWTGATGPTVLALRVYQSRQEGRRCMVGRVDVATRQLLDSYPSIRAMSKALGLPYTTVANRMYRKNVVGGYLIVRLTPVNARPASAPRVRVIDKARQGAPCMVGMVDVATGQILDSFPKLPHAAASLGVPYKTLSTRIRTKQVVDGYRVSYLAPVDTNATWLPCEGYPGYEVSDGGQVRCTATGLEVLAKLTEQRLRVLVGGRYVAVKQLVATAFMDPPPWFSNANVAKRTCESKSAVNPTRRGLVKGQRSTHPTSCKPEVATPIATSRLPRVIHVDGDPRNCRISNLAWDTTHVPEEVYTAVWQVHPGSGERIAIFRNTQVAAGAVNMESGEAGYLIRKALISQGREVGGYLWQRASVEEARKYLPPGQQWRGVSGFTD